MENIEKKMEELCLATKNTKESQIKSELQLVSTNEKINFISEKFDKWIDVKKTKLLKICQKNPSEMAQRIDKLENLVDQQEQYSRRNCLLVHGIAETNDKNTDDLAVKTINERLASILQKARLIGLTELEGKRMDRDRDQLLLN